MGNVELKKDEKRDGERPDHSHQSATRVRVSLEVMYE
jgi:hypothetical protein